MKSLEYNENCTDPRAHVVIDAEELLLVVGKLALGALLGGEHSKIGATPHINKM